MQEQSWKVKKSPQWIKKLSTGFKGKRVKRSGGFRGERESERKLFEELMAENFVKCWNVLTYKCNKLSEPQLG